jgi:integration host factor subunit beta
MIKSDLIAALAKKEHLTEKQAMDVINQILKSFTGTLKNGDRIEIRGWGIFSVREYEAYKGRNPKSGSKVDVKPKRLPFFKVGRELKKIVDTKKSKSILQNG